MLVLLAACASDAPAPPGVAEPGPRWFAGDVHVHATGGSNDTDDVSTPAAIAQVARARALDFVVLTDHSNATGSMHCEDGTRTVEDCPNLGPEFPHADVAETLTEAGFLMVVGNEISPVSALGVPGPPTGHIGCLPPSSGRFPGQGAFVDRPPGDVPSAHAARQCRDAGGFSILNHPYALATWVRADWTTTDVDGVEVWNGGSGWDVWDQRSLKAWECLAIRALHEGRRPPSPIAASDCHRVHTPADSESATNPPLGRPRTSIQAEALDWAALRASLVSGRVPVVLHEDDTWLTATGGRSPVAGRVEVRRLRLSDTDCDPSTADDGGPLHHEVTAAQEVSAGQFELDVDLPRSPYYLVLTRDELPAIQAGDVAMTGLYGL